MISSSFTAYVSALCRLACCRSTLVGVHRHCALGFAELPLHRPHIRPGGFGAAADMMEQLFWLDEEVPGIINLVRTQRSEIRYNGNDDWPPGSPAAIWFDSTVLRDFLKDWAEVQRKLPQGENTGAEYFEWKICWPERADK